MGLIPLSRAGLPLSVGPAHGFFEEAEGSGTVTKGKPKTERQAQRRRRGEVLADEIAKRAPSTADLGMAALTAKRPEANREIAKKTEALEAALTAAIGATRVVDDLHPYQGVVPSRTILGLLTWAAALLGQERATWSAAPPRGKGHPRKTGNLMLECLHKQGFTYAQMARAGLAEDADQAREHLRGDVKKQRQRAREKEKSHKRVRGKARRPLAK